MRDYRLFSALLQEDFTLVNNLVFSSVEYIQLINKGCYAGRRILTLW